MSNDYSEHQILPCPFCGADGSHVKFFQAQPSWWKRLRGFAYPIMINCSKCGATPWGRETIDELIGLWNMRGENE